MFSKIVQMLLIQVAILAVSTACASAQVPTMTNDHVIQMVQVGMTEDQILTGIRGSDGKYSFGPEDLARLKKGGVSNRVVQAMKAKMAENESASKDSDRNSVPEPEQEGVYYYYDQADQRLIPLARETATLRGKAKLGGFAGGKSVLEVQGERSPTRLRASGPLTFLLRVSGPGGVRTLYYQQDNALPQLAGQLYTFKSTGRKRERMQSEIAIYGVVGKSKDKTAGDVGLQVSRATGNILRITTATPLPPGEYAFLSSSYDMTALFTFGVEP